MKTKAVKLTYSISGTFLFTNGKNDNFCYLEAKISFNPKKQC